MNKQQQINELTFQQADRLHKLMKLNDELNGAPITLNKHAEVLQDISELEADIHEAREKLQSLVFVQKKPSLISRILKL